MIDNKHFGPVIIILMILIIGIPLTSSGRITGDATSVGGVEVSTTTGFLLGVLLICGVLLLFYGRSNDFGMRSGKRRFRLAYNPGSDIDRLRLYIKDRLDSHESEHKIKNTLVKVGWGEGIVGQAFNTLDEVKPIKPKKKFRFKLKKNARAK